MEFTKQEIRLLKQAKGYNPKTKLMLLAVLAVVMGEIGGVLKIVDALMALGERPHALSDLATGLMSIGFWMLFFGLYYSMHRMSSLLQKVIVASSFNIPSSNEHYTKSEEGQNLSARDL